MKERYIANEAYSESKHVTLFRCHRNFSTWYEIEIFTMGPGNKVEGSYTSCREYPEVDSAFDKFDSLVKSLKLTILEQKEA